MIADRNMPDLIFRFGAFADVGSEAEVSAYFSTAAEAEAYARGLWAGLTEEARRAILAELEDEEAVA